VLKFLIKNLSTGQHFLDIGTHFGFFSLLASYLVESKGRVLGIEASPKSFAKYKKNIAPFENIIPLNKAASNEQKTITFHEFNTTYSEYNTTDIEQFKNESWFKKNPPNKIAIETIVTDKILTENKIQPNIIKIDVEGAEYEVLQGLTETLKTLNPFVSVEFLPKYINSTTHQKALILMKEMGYLLHYINNEGNLVELDFMELNNYFILNNIDSENLIFAKKG
jgi:FkbM family methyltransferase